MNRLPLYLEIARAVGRVRWRGMSRRLRSHLEIERAVRKVMADRYPDLPKLFWSVSTAGHLQGMVQADVHDDDQSQAVLRQWVQRLGLSPTTGPVVAGAAEYVGTVDRWVTVEVWGLVDRARFEAVTRRRDAGGGAA